jgi:hypothetical protein
LAEEFVVGDGTVAVADREGVFRPIPTPDGFTDLMFRNIVSAADVAYRLNGKLPDVADIQAVFPKAPQKTIAALLITDEFSQAMTYRGIDWTEDAGLTMEQAMALLKLTDPTDRRMTNVKLKELGIPMPRFQAWMKNPLFANHYQQRSEAVFREAVPMVMTKIVGAAEAGDLRAMEKVLEITGRWNPAQQQIEDVRILVRRVIEAIIKNVPDAATRRAILNDIEEATTSYALVRPQQSNEG